MGYEYKDCLLVEYEWNFWKVCVVELSVKKYWMINSNLPAASASARFWVAASRAAAAAAAAAFAAC